MLGLKYMFLWRAPNFYKYLIKLFVDLLKKMIDILEKYLYLHHAAK